MKKLLIILIFTMFGFGEINWQTEIVDSCNFFTFNALALDTNNVPHVVYYKYKPDFISHKIVYATRTLSDWQKEVVESGLYLYYYGFSIIFDSENIPHLSYYRRDDAVGKTYVCYAKRENTGWHRVAVDSITGSLGYWALDIYSSIDLDTSSLPGIAYIAWNVEDSLHYVKYAHYNSINWDTSIVEYDSAYANIQKTPTDWSPSLKYSSTNIPYIAFYQYFNNYDTIKLAYFDDTMSCWLIEPVVNMPGTSPVVSLRLNSQDYPCIAHGWGVDVAYSWWDGTLWHTENTGATMGWAGIRIILDLNSLDNPHIVYLPDPLVAHPSYSYKTDGTWYNCGWIEPDPNLITYDVHISFALDNNNEPHVCYPCEGYGNVYFKYARGTSLSVEKQNSAKNLRTAKLEVYPNPFSKLIHISFGKVHPDRITQSSCGTGSAKCTELKIYDVTGQLIRRFDNQTMRLSGKLSWNGTDECGNQVPNGIYFIRLNNVDYCETEKVILSK